MDKYLVGGAVRDHLLGRAVHERDWVLVGADPAALLAQGYKQVGRDFPVFLHPETHEEHALARTERKVGHGYQGFAFHAAPDVTLEDDLKRRDLTINAMAMVVHDDHQGEVIDPYGGQADLAAKCLRHVSAAFVEDPVRVLRVARFASQLPGFEVHPETLQLMQTMVKSGETDYLVAERVWQECAKAVVAPAPWRFFEVLSEVGLASKWMAECVPDVNALRAAAKVSEVGEVRWACCWWRCEATLVASLCQQWRAPKSYLALATLTSAHAQVLQAMPMEAPVLLQILQSCDALRRPDRFAQLLQVASVCSEGFDAGLIETFWEGALEAAHTVDAAAIVKQHPSVDAQAAIAEARLGKLKAYLESLQQ